MENRVPASSEPAPGRDVPLLYRAIAADASRSRAAAVKLFCLECVGYSRKDATACTATRCPLYRWRPYQRGEGDSLPPEIPVVTAPESTQPATDRSGDSE